MPPSVTSCIALAPFEPAKAAAKDTSKASLIIFKSILSASFKSTVSFKIKLPSEPAYPVKRTASPTHALLILTPFFFPTAVTHKTIRLTASVISVCPPTISTFTLSAAFLADLTTFSISSILELEGHIRVIKTAIGVAPAAAISFTDTYIARVPASGFSAVIGSVDKTQRSPPKFKTAESMPIPAPTTVSSLLFLPIKSKTDFLSCSFVSFPISMLLG